MGSAQGRTRGAQTVTAILYRLRARLHEWRYWRCTCYCCRRWRVVALFALVGALVGVACWRSF